MANKSSLILKQVERVIVGKNDIVSRVLMAILSGGHILMEDVPGTGKTTLALAFAKSLGIDFKRIQFTSDSMPSDVIGFSVYDKSGNALSYKPGAAMTNLLLADEINRTSGPAVGRGGRREVSGHPGGVSLREKSADGRKF